MAKKTISNTFNVNTLRDGETYNIEWSDAFGVINNIVCFNNGWAKYKPNGGAGEWIRATLYYKEGSGVSQAVQCYEIYLRAYLSNGTEDTSNGWPKHVYTTNHIALEGYDENTSHVYYKAEFYDINHNFLGTNSIYKTIDGASAPRYTEETYAWSNDATTADVTTAPAISGSWSTAIPAQGGYAYLWKKIVLYTYNIGTNTYSAGTEQYFRMSGENGTSIHTKGSVLAVVKYWVNAQSALPTSGETNGTLAWVDGTNYLLEYHEGSTGWWAQSITLHDGDRVLFYDPNLNASARKKVYEFEYDDFEIIGNINVYDGDAYTEQQEGHLWQWSDEATTWLDLGQFKGEAGVTYYTHVAWADSVTFRSSPISPAEGCLNKRNASNVSGGTITPRTSQSASKPYMGIRIDQVAGSDSTVWTTYTWELVQGAQGERGKTGKFYYYGGVFDPQNSTTTFVVNDANTPYFKYTSGTTTNYWVYIKEVAEGNYTMSQMGTPSSENADWRIMTDDFKYIITEAIFGNFAKFGSAIISGDWMLSTNGTINGTAYNNGAFYNGSEAYTWFDPSNPSNSVNGSHTNGTHTWTGYNFIPNYCVDLLTGVIYTNAAVLKTGCKVGGFNIDNEELRVGDNADWTNPQTNHPYTLLGKGRSRFLYDDGNSLVQVSMGLNSDADNSRRALTVIRNDKSNNYPNSPAVEIRHISSYGSIGVRVQTGVAVFQEGIIPFSDFHYVDGNITLSGLYGNSIFFKGSNGTHQVTLPTYTEILNSLTYGMPSNVFALELTLATHIGSSAIEIKMPSGGYIMDYNGYIVNSITIAAGKYVKLMLVYDGTTYYAQKVYASYDM